MYIDMGNYAGQAAISARQTFRTQPVSAALIEDVPTKRAFVSTNTCSLSSSLQNVGVNLISQAGRWPKASDKWGKR